MCGSFCLTFLSAGSGSRLVMAVASVLNLSEQVLCFPIMALCLEFPVVSLLRAGRCVDTCIRAAAPDQSAPRGHRRDSCSAQERLGKGCFFPAWLVPPLWPYRGELTRIPTTKHRGFWVPNATTWPLLLPVPSPALLLNPSAILRDGDTGGRDQVSRELAKGSWLLGRSPWEDAWIAQ